MTDRAAVTPRDTAQSPFFETAARELSEQLRTAELATMGPPSSSTTDAAAAGRLRNARMIAESFARSFEGWRSAGPVDALVKMRQRDDLLAFSQFVKALLAPPKE